MGIPLGYSSPASSGAVISQPPPTEPLSFTWAELLAERARDLKLGLIPPHSSQIIWLSESMAKESVVRPPPLVVQRFGDIRRLVEQTLDPMVSAYFKNIGQTRTLIQLLQERSAIQQIASEEMKEKFKHYNLELEEVLIGTPASNADDKQIEVILTQLRQRQVAEEQVETYIRNMEKTKLLRRNHRSLSELCRLATPRVWRPTRRRPPPH